MSAPIRIVVVIDSEADRNAVEAVIPAASGVELLNVVEGLNNAWHEVGAEDVDAVLVASGASSAAALGFTEGVSTEYPDRAVLLLHAGSVNGLRAAPSRPAPRTWWRCLSRMASPPRPRTATASPESCSLRSRRALRGAGGPRTARASPRAG